MTVLVAGGGITGLAAAYELGSAGVPTLLVEASDRLGGKIRTERADGFLIEHGPDSFITTRPAAVTLARTLGLGASLVGVREPRTVYIRHRGRLVRMPEGLGLVLPTRAWPFVRTPLFSLAEKARMGLDIVLPRQLGEDDEAVGTFLRRRLGGALVERLAGPLVGGIYGTPIDELSIDAVVPQLRTGERIHRSLLLAGLADGRAMRAAAERRRLAAAASDAGRDGATTSVRPLGVFATLSGGMGELVDRLAEALAAMNGTVTVRTRTSVRELDAGPASATARLSDGSVVRADAVVVAVPGPAAARLLRPTAPAAATAIDEIRHGSSAVVSLAYRSDRLDRLVEGHGVLLPAREGLSLSACTWSSQKWEGRAPDGTILVRAFVPDGVGSGLTDEGLSAIARADVQRLLGTRGEPELERVARWEAAMPRYTVGHLERVARAEAALAPYPSIELVGAPFHGVGVPDCISQGRAAAARVVERLEGNVAAAS
jgi:oxygen-dependent protoporphyrinogen oxidase